MSSVVKPAEDAKSLLSAWLRREVEAMPEPRPSNWACWTINCDELYRLYQKHALHTPYRMCTKAEFWDVMKSVFPLCQIATVGRDLEKVFDKVRRTWPMTEEDLRREEKTRQMKMRWAAKWGDDGGK